MTATWVPPPPPLPGQIAGWSTAIAQPPRVADRAAEATARTLGPWLAAGVGVSIGLRLLHVVSLAVLAGQVRDLADSPATATVSNIAVWDQLQRVSFITELIALTLTGIVLIVWTRAAVKAVRAMRLTTLSADLATWGWFIPVAGLVIGPLSVIHAARARQLDAGLPSIDPFATAWAALTAVGTVVFLASGATVGRTGIIESLQAEADRYTIYLAAELLWAAGAAALVAAVLRTTAGLRRRP